MAIRALIVDDEPLARRKIRRLLRAASDVAVVGECGSGPAAATAIRDLAPDLVFLDVQMPGMDGFDALASAAPARAPAVIFTTAYEEHAVRAFDVRALDYLVKPFARARFDEALGRARAALDRQPRESAAQFTSLLEELRRERSRANHLVAKEDGRVRLVAVDGVGWIGAAGNYARVHTIGGATHLVRESMTTLESRLDPRRFVRVHRSAIVNISCVKEIQPWFRGDHVLILRDGTRVMMSRTYAGRMRELLGT